MIRALKHVLPLLLLILIPVATVASQYKFYSVSDGLSSSNITSLLQDSEGFMWIATEDGLNRFDGNNFVVYRNVPNDSTSLINDHVMKIYEDRKGRFWVATLTGLCLYDRATDRFIPYHSMNQEYGENLQFYNLLEDKQGYIWGCVSGNGVVRIDADKHEYLSFNTSNSGICSDHINVIYEDRFGNIWLGSGREGLSVYNPGNGTFRTFRHDPDQKHSISSDEISSITEDEEGNVWIGTWVGGIDIYSFTAQSFRKFDYLPRKITCLQKDNKGNIWIGTMGDGFDVYSTSENRILRSDIQSASVDLSSKIQVVCEDRQGNIWIGLFQKGIFMIPHIKNLFNNYTYNPFSAKPTIGDGAVQPVLLDSSGELWVGVDGKGIYRLDSLNHIVAHYGMDSKSVFFNNVVLCIYEDSKGFIWFGTFFDGVIRYNPKTNRFDKRLRKGKAPLGLLSSQINNITEGQDGKIWFSTNGGGINIYHPDTDTFEYIVRDEFKKEQNQLIDNYASITITDQQGVYWIGTFRGLCSYDRKANKFRYYTMKNGSLPNDIVFYLKADSRGNIWVGTQNGLACIYPDRENINQFTINDGLPNSMILGIEEDETGNIWLVTNHGLSMLDVSTAEFTNFTTSDGLYTNEFKKNAITKTNDGKFIVGSMKGFTSFYPAEQFVVHEEPLNLIFNNFYIFNEPVYINDPENKVLDRHINHTDKVTLTHAQNSFSVDFSTIAYLTPDKVHYEVMMEGFDQHWRTVKNKMVTYTNLSPGNYVLTVRAWITDKEQALVRKLHITKLPPFWATYWAQFIYVFIILVVTYFIYRHLNERMTVKRKERMIQAKLQFFTDISHEIRTPLTLILSPLSKLIIQNTDTKLTQTYNLMYKNGIRLLQLVNQVMDLRAVEFGKKNLSVEEVNITMFVRDLKNSFNNLAEERNLSYSFTSDPEIITGFIDTDIVSKVLFNLISNAFKYTAKGYIAVSLTVRDGQIEISIADSGKGIAEEQKQLVFERFYMDTSDRKHSSGIGLHLTGKLVALHHGKIALESKIGEGSRFTVILPYRANEFAKKEFARNKSAVQYADPIVHTDINFDISQSKASKRKHTLLVVEDHDDIRKLIVSEMSSNYQVLEATNGKEGLKTAIEKKPDLIISDVLMPEMDGIEFCTKIRHNESTMHIPFIMLTARSSVEQQIEGLDHGADAYIAKPFDFNYLSAKVKRLLVSRNGYKSSEKEGAEQKDNSDRNYSPEDGFLRRLNELIDEHLDDPELSVDVLSKKIGLSRTHLNRKMKELTGESPASYIRQLRLRKSAQLLKEQNLTVSEIAFTVGFSSPSYFSQAFRDYYGVTPKEYVHMENGRH